MTNSSNSVHCSKIVEIGETHEVNPEPKQFSQKLLTLEDVAIALGVSRDWVRDHATRRNPRIPVVRLGAKRAVLRFRQQDLDKFIADHLVCSSPETGGEYNA